MPLVDPEALMSIAGEARAHAHAPYSGFRVGAAVQADDETITAGANVENASYGLSLCAERVAIASAVTHGAGRIVAVAVAAGDDDVAPCGACRQFIAEHGDATTEVHFVEDGRRVMRTLHELLPSAFTLPGGTPVEEQKGSRP